VNEIRNDDEALQALVAWDRRTHGLQAEAKVIGALVELALPLLGIEVDRVNEPVGGVRITLTRSGGRWRLRYGMRHDQVVEGSSITECAERARPVAEELIARLEQNVSTLRVVMSGIQDCSSPPAPTGEQP
jgi:hypothetical protein